MDCQQDSISSCVHFVTTDLHSVLPLDHRDYIFNITKEHLMHDPEGQLMHQAMPFGLNRQHALQLLRENLLQHRWGDAAVILLGITQVNWKQASNPKQRMIDDIMWRVGTDVLSHHPSGANNFMTSAYKRAMMSYNEKVDQVHLLLEYTFGLLIAKDFATAKEELRLYPNIEKGVVHKQSRINNIAWWSVVAEGYLGLIDYVLWKSTVLHCTNSNDFSQSGAADDFSSQHAKLGSSACQHFSEVISKPGVWDIFIQKYIEILVFYGKSDDAKCALETYSVTHQDNPNAHKMLYAFVCDHQPTSSNSTCSTVDVKITILKRLVQVAPSEEIVLDLHHLLFHKWLKDGDPQARCHFEADSNLTESVEVLLNMLDYFCWRDAPNIWKALYDAIQWIKKKTGRKQMLKYIRNIFVASERIHWWPAYHFSESSVLIESSSNVKIIEKSKSFIAHLINLIAE